MSTAVEGYKLVDGTQITLTFDGANIAATGGCNRSARRGPSMATCWSCPTWR